MIDHKVLWQSSLQAVISFSQNDFLSDFVSIPSVFYFQRNSFDRVFDDTKMASNPGYIPRPSRRGISAESRREPSSDFLTTRFSAEKPRLLWSGGQLVW